MFAVRGRRWRFKSQSAAFTLPVPKQRVAFGIVAMNFLQNHRRVSENSTTVRFTKKAQGRNPRENYQQKETIHHKLKKEKPREYDSTKSTQCNTVRHNHSYCRLLKFLSRLFDKPLLKTQRRLYVNASLASFKTVCDQGTALTLSLPRVMNFKFPLQPHQKYYITQWIS